MHVLATIADFEHAALEARPAAFFADQLNVGQELHFYRYRAITLAGFTTPARNVEGEMTTVVSTTRGFGLRRKGFADRIEGFDISHRIRARRAANRRLIDQHNILDQLGAIDLAAVHALGLRRHSFVG